MDLDPTTDRSAAIVPLAFWTDHRDIDGEMREFHMVRWVKKGQPGAETEQRVDRAKRNQIIWSTLKPYYEHWLGGLAEPVTGTPLDVWPAVTKGQVDRLRSLHLRSIEDVAAADEDTMRRIGMGARELKRKAEAWVANKDSNKTAGEIAKLEEENELLRGRMAELEEQIQLLAADKGVDPAPKRRGRPPKAA